METITRLLGLTKSPSTSTQQDGGAGGRDDTEQLRTDPWFSHLHDRMARHGFAQPSTMPSGHAGWFIDPEHLVGHILKHGVELRWAYRPEEHEARDLLDLSTNLMVHCQQTVGPAHSFIGSFASRQATFLLFSCQEMFRDNPHLALAYCLPGDALGSQQIPIASTGCMSPWVDDDGMVNCLELLDSYDGRRLVSMGAPGRGRDLHTIFVAHHANIERARASAQHHALSTTTHPSTGVARARL